jgi:deoxyribodipyrimidine photolyase-related protein
MKPSGGKRFPKLRLILGDQLHRGHTWYRSPDPGVLYLIAEMRQETDYVKHHQQKLCAFFLAMEAFAHELHQSGHQVLYLTLDDTADFADLAELLGALCQRYTVTELEYQQPDEYRLARQLETLGIGGVAIRCCDSQHFLLPFDDIPEHFAPGKHQRMENFYRWMRRHHQILMDNGEPLGGQWNYDADNRNKLRPADLAAIPAPLLFANAVGPIRRRLERHGVKSFGECTDTLLWPINREQSLQLLRYFCQHCLPRFGTFQDAMTGRCEHQWSLYHSRLSFSLNTKMLHPLEVIEAALGYQDSAGNGISLAQVEGFVRQILGWREHVRGVYWTNMPRYSQLNALAARRPLPDFFWTAKTRMRCLEAAIGQSLQLAYAHHIQRLMITGNFCLLAGIDPAQVDAWYLGVYVDAIEWVELPNTRGMSQFADDGILATKPYAASGNYVQKMSDYCADCTYQVKEKHTATACPLNSLYWNFMVQHRSRLQRNPRIGMVYRNWDKQSEEQRSATLERAQWCLQHIDSL